MESRELAKKIRSIEIKSNKLVDEVFSGEYRSGFRGKGMEFDNIRLYVPGDDVRGIDWNVTARQNKVFVKQFREERELNIVLLIDMSGSNSFGAKNDIIAEIGATLAFSATRNNDRVGAIFFSDRVEKVIPSKSGKKHALSIIESILNFQPESKGTDIGGAIRFFNRIEKKPGVLFLISDFLDEGYEREMKIAARRHDFVRIRVADRGEERIPSGAIFTFKDLETGEDFILDNTAGEYEPPHPLGSKENLITVYTDCDYVLPLKQFFKRRGAR